jgi:glycosyltransferase involved in cell wall biosynthesis
LNILLINHYAGSPRHGMEYRPYYLAREWVRLGHSVKIVASSQSHVRAQQPQLEGKDFLNETIDGIQYTWFQTPDYVGNGIGRVRNMASFVSRLYREGRQLACSFKPDVVIASSTYPMDIWPARRIARLTKAKLVFEVHDLWPLSPMELGGMSKWHPFILMVQAAEGYAYRHADVVVSMLPKVREYMESRRMAPHKLHIVQNGFDPEEWCASELAIPNCIKDLVLSNKESGKFLVGYAGAHGIPNSLDSLLDAAKLASDKDVIFVMVGDGHEKQRLQQRVIKEQITNVYMFDSIPKNQIPGFLSQLDAAYLGAPLSPLYRFGVSPNKMLDYMMAEVPIIYAVKAGNDPIAEAECGITIPAEDGGAIVNAIIGFSKMPKNERQVLGARGRRYAEQHYAYSKLASKFLSAVSEG